MMASPFFPILVSDECQGSIMIAPRQLWPNAVLEEWNDMIRTKYGEQYVPRRNSGIQLEPQAPSIAEPEPEYEEPLPRLDTVPADHDLSDGSPWLFIAVGLFMFVIAWFLYSVLTGIEQSGESVRIHWIVALLYKTLGKLAACGLFALMGCLSMAFGFIKFRNDF